MSSIGNNKNADGNVDKDFNKCQLCYTPTVEMKSCDYCEKKMCIHCERIENKYNLCIPCHLEFCIWNIKSTDLIDVKLGNAHLCEYCNRIWDGNAQCDCYENGWDEFVE